MTVYCHASIFTKGDDYLDMVSIEFDCSVNQSSKSIFFRISNIVRNKYGENTFYRIIDVDVVLEKNEIEDPPEKIYYNPMYLVIANRITQNMRSNDHYCYCTNMGLLGATKYKHVFSDGKIINSNFFINDIDYIEDFEQINEFEKKHRKDKLIDYFLLFPDRIYNPKLANPDYTGPICYQHRNYQVVDNDEKNFGKLYLAEMFSRWVSVKFKLVIAEKNYIYTNNNKILEIYDKNFPNKILDLNGKPVVLCYNPDEVQEFSHIFRGIEDSYGDFITTEFEIESDE